MRKAIIITGLLLITPLFSHATGPYTLPFYEEHSISSYFDTDPRDGYVSDYIHTTPWTTSTPWVPGYAYDKHKGTDYSMSSSTKVAEAAGGQVVDRADNRSNTYDPLTDTCTTPVNGNFLEVDNGNNLHSFYLHLLTGGLQVNLNDAVSRNQYIAQSGNTGCSSGPHLHFEIQDNSVSKDPYSHGYWTTTPPVLAAQTVSGNITSNTIWSTNQIYIIDGNLTIDSGVTLTINSGVVVKFKTATSMLTVNGTLDVNGTVGGKVYFTSYKDDTVGGDTNENGSSNSPAVGNWEVINISSGGVADFNYALIRYGGAANSWQQSFPNIRNYGSLTINNSEVSHSLDVGVQGYGSVNNIYTSYFHDNNFAGIRLDNSSDADIDANTIQNNGTAGIYDATDADYSVTDNTFGNSGSGAILIVPEEGGNFTHSGNTSNGTFGGYSYASGSLAVNTTWTSGDLPYLIMETLTVPSGKTLTVNPGVIVKSDSNISVSGVLDVVTNGTNKVYFTSYKDDTIGGDTNGDSTASTPAISDWYGIHVSSVGDATIANSVLRYSDVGAIRINGGTLDLSDSEVANNAEGLRITNPSTITLDSNSFHNNSSFGARNFTTTTVNAQGNYWGHSSGPYHTSNSGGTGDSVTDYIDFSSWLTTWP